MSSKYAPKWSEQASLTLFEPEAPRAFALSHVQSMGESVAGHAVSEAGARAAARDWVARGLAHKARRGMWANLASSPAGRLDDVMRLERPDAVSSLHSVLGSSGAHNNPSVMAFGVCPLDEESPKELPSVPTTLGDMRFYGLPRRFFDSKAGSDWTQPHAARPSFAPEKALIDWIYLGGFAEARLPPPNPVDVDLDALDLGKAGGWANELGLKAELAGWLARHPEPNDASRELVRQARAEGLTAHQKDVAKHGPTMRERARKRGLAR